MIVLGINDGHDAGVCLLVDGKIVLCSSEERRVNRKNCAGIPYTSINEVLKRSGIATSDINIVALSSKLRTTIPTPGHKPIYSLLSFLSSIGRSQWATTAGRWLLSSIRKRRDLVAYLSEMGIGNAKLVAFDHHLCHAATAYFHRPWQGPATVLTLDGAGDGICATVNHGSSNQIRLLARTTKYHSPAAWMYSAVTAYLGLKPYEHEYKVMGMAPYGQSGPCSSVFRDAFQVQGLEFRNRSGTIARGMQHYLRKRLYQQRFDNIAAACQQVFEELIIAWVQNAISATGIGDICAAGGAFLNVKANKLIRELPEVTSLFVYPASDDGGTPVGAALLGYLQLCTEKQIVPSLKLPKDMYLGFEFSEHELESAARNSGLRYRKLKNPSQEIATLLAAGNIIGRFAGREELGPRALGNRSILADPRDLRVIRKLNFAIKQRDFWMPFAASVLDEDANKYIRNLNQWPYYMIEAFDTTACGADHLIAGVHPYDQTIRPQVVNHLNPQYRDILVEFKNLTGVGGLLNTSFNLHGSPIVGTPEVAIETLKNSALDALILDTILVTKG